MFYTISNMTYIDLSYTEWDDTIYKIYSELRLSNRIYQEKLNKYNLIKDERFRFRSTQITFVDCMMDLLYEKNANIFIQKVKMLKHQ